MKIIAIISWCLLGLQIGFLVMQIVFARRAHREWKLAQFWLDKTKKLNLFANEVYSRVSHAAEEEQSDG